jgi:Fanconi anemia group J protein
VGNLLRFATQISPGGVLLFLPSYSFMNKVTARLSATGAAQELSGIAPIFCEPKESAELKQVPCPSDVLVRRPDEKVLISPMPLGVFWMRVWQTLKEFQEEVHRSGKAVLIAVCRGKVSEGIDFSDSYARTVIVVGIPFPSIKDLHVKLKREHQNVLAAENSACVTGDVWYKQQAYRAINQVLRAVGSHRRTCFALCIGVYR